MLKIKNLEEGVIDLNSYDTSDELVFDVISHYDDEKSSPCTWWIDFLTNDNDDILSIEEEYYSKIRIVVDLEKFKEEEIFCLANHNGDFIPIKIVPNSKRIAAKRYSFKIQSANNAPSIDVNGDVITISGIKSTENGKKTPWSVNNDGKPLSYDISIDDSKCMIKLLSKIITSEFESTITLKQDKSGKEVSITIIYSTNDEQYDSHMQWVSKVLVNGAVIYTKEEMAS